MQINLAKVQVMIILSFDELYSCGGVPSGVGVVATESHNPSVQSTPWKACERFMKLLKRFDRYHISMT